MLNIRRALVLSVPTDVSSAFLSVKRRRKILTSLAIASMVQLLMTKDLGSREKAAVRVEMERTLCRRRGRKSPKSSPTRQRSQSLISKYILVLSGVYLGVVPVHVYDATPRCLSRTLLQFAKKKRKRSDSGSDVELDITPPPSPKEDEMIEKRRSGRNTNKRKKYVDDVDLNLSDEENLMATLPPDVAAEIKATGGTTGKAEAAAAGEVTGTKDGEATPADGAATPARSVSAVSSTPQTPSQEHTQSGPNYAFIVSAQLVVFMTSWTICGVIPLTFVF